jgi:hypothetical protein
MNNFNSRQRKTTYIVGILVLLVPIVLLGMPSSGGAEASGGMLARMRSEYDLGENDLGKIDPTSATMNLVLLGLRGVAVNVLRLQLDEFKDHKEWAQMQATTEAVITLQPHYIEVWRFLSWNLAYNVSAEWDAVPDRYFWVKEGGKFAQRGTEHNAAVPELYWETGRVWGQKVGRSDEWNYFRKYFINDPDTETFNGADPEINPQQKDNYLVSKDWFQSANQAEENKEQHIMMRALFRAWPARSQLEYADALQRDTRHITAALYEGTADNPDLMAEEARRQNFQKSVQAWKDGFFEWTQDFGKMPLQSPKCKIYLEANEEDVKTLADEQGVDVSVVKQWVRHYQNTANYRYWRTRSLAESTASADPNGLNTAEAHRLLYEGELSYFDGRFDDARDKLVRGMQKYARLLEEFPELMHEDLTIEEGLRAVLIWKKILQIEKETVPETFALKPLWDAHPNQIPLLQEKLDRGY